MLCVLTAVCDAPCQTADGNVSSRQVLDMFSLLPSWVGTISCEVRLKGRESLRESI